MSSRANYQGLRRKLVLAFDLGTTYSGISYSILDPGQVPEIKPVTRFPAQEHISGASKIPTIIYYDQTGQVRAAGAEAVRHETFEAADDGNWVKAEWFKLHLRSKVSQGSNSQISKVLDKIPPLPLNKTVVEVFADFLEYLLQCASRYIEESHANGSDLWNSVKNNIDFVLSHPNGWEGSEQSRMRDAAVLAGLVPDNASGRSRVSFVTEGEASLHFAIQNSVLSQGVKKGDGVVVVDAGGGTIDVSAYRQSPKGKQAFEEIAVPQCHFHGSVFVNVHARTFIEAFLANSKFSGDIDYIVECFEKTTKPRFRASDTTQYIKFGSARDNDPDHNIRLGQLKLEGSDVALFFEPAINCIVNAVLEQQKTSTVNIMHVVLVGGFSANDWLFHSVQTSLREHNLNVLRPENHVNKAASDGAISFYLDHVVKSRITKVTYGAFSTRSYNPNDPEHVARSATKYRNAQGNLRIPGCFSAILPKNTQVSEVKEYRKVFHSLSTTPIQIVTTRLWAYRGQMSSPRWKDVDTENYTKLCNISANVSHVPQPLKEGPNGDMYHEVEYDIVLMFGLTELKVQVAWMEDGIEKRSAARIVYEMEEA
ncbi:hypothetical protein M413DRAFT_264068 [Hebeloma cylindrosporum]|uniref:Uncharacterized protein n=1 Tax=Hebeloma cylindrosporum TaxID=76867 RepID=A0A0C3CDI7_HEBCY|nr:hypothetical protein M413DRAFT_264068 [Hebeloma cylindrosporum h7]